MATVTAGTERDIMFGWMRGRVASFTAVSDNDTYNTGMQTIYFAGIMPDEDVNTADFGLTVTASGGTLTFRVIAGTDTVDTAKIFVVGT